MPNIKSAKKRVLIGKARNARNKATKSDLKTAIKKFEAAAAEGNRDRCRWRLQGCGEKGRSGCGEGCSPQERGRSQKERHDPEAQSDRLIQHIPAPGVLTLPCECPEAVRPKGHPFGCPFCFARRCFSMPIFDTHAHYDSNGFAADRDEILSALPAAGGWAGGRSRL